VGKCLTGLEPKDCRSDHYLPVLGGWMEKAGGRAPCPECHSERAISAQIRNRQVVTNSFCDCPPDVVDKAIAVRVPCHARRRGARDPAAGLGQLAALLLDKSLPPNALRIACLLTLGMPGPQIREKLALSKQSWSDAVRILGQNRRSASAAPVRIPGPPANAKSPDSRTEPQVRKVHKAA
jgi:hypothetical protein